MFLGFRNCPHCDALLDTDTEIFVQGSDVIGCENCVRLTWADFEELDEEELEELEADYYDSMYDEMKCERVLGI